MIHGAGRVAALPAHTPERRYSMAQQRFVTVCPLANCAKVNVKPSREEARKADRRHWERVHAKQGVSSPNMKEGR